MPRIYPDLLDCVIYLYPSQKAAEKGEAWGGSGFLVEIQSERGGSHLYAATTSHVVQEMRSPVIRINTVDGAVSVLPLTQDDWKPHPTDDLAVAQLDLDRRTYRFHAIHRERFLTLGHVQAYGVGPGDEAFMIGRFITQDGKQRNLPTVRFGHVARMHGEPIEHQLRKTLQDCLLVDLRSQPGYSGSPVFWHRPFARTARIRWHEEQDPDSIVRWPDPEAGYDVEGQYLLGVHFAQFPYKASVKRWKNGGFKEQKDWLVNTGSGISAVIPAWTLLTFLTTDPRLLMGRKERDDQREAEAKEARAIIEGAENTEGRRGPAPERLKIDTPMDEAVKRMFKKGKPPKGDG